MARELGLVPTWPNLQIIRLAIETEARYSRVALELAAHVIACSAKEITYPSQYFSAWELSVANTIDASWFANARWRIKGSYLIFRHDLQGAQKPPEPRVTASCKCNGRGYVFNDGPGPRTLPCPECEAVAC